MAQAFCYKSDLEWTRLEHRAEIDGQRILMETDQEECKGNHQIRLCIPQPHSEIQARMGTANSRVQFSE